MFSSLSSSEETETVGGYDVILEDATQEERFKCPLCVKLMREPIQTSRGELACRCCFKNALRSSGKCPIDGLPIKATEYFPDKSKEKEILNISVLCSYCKEQYVMLRDLQKHINVCAYQHSGCSFCGERVTMGTHTEEHLQHCPKFLSESSCYLAKYGCTAKFVMKDAHLKHLKESSSVHLVVQDKVVGEIQKDNLPLRNEFDKVRCHATESTMQTSFENNKLSQQMALETKSMNVKETNMSLRLQQEEPTIVLGSANYVVDQEATAVLTTNIAGIDERLTNIYFKQQLLENTAYDSKYIWEIDNVKHRLQQAVTGKLTALHSAYCFTEKYGYKFGGHLYLNGDGISKCTHMSLFIVIMKAEYENVLSWPVTKCVTFRLINIDDKSKSLSESFAPDRFSSCFQKPTRDLNIEAVCLLFASADALEPSKGFLKDDSLYLEIIVG